MLVTSPWSLSLSNLWFAKLILSARGKMNKSLMNFFFQNYFLIQQWASSSHQFPLNLTSFVSTVLYTKQFSSFGNPLNTFQHCHECHFNIVSFLILHIRFVIHVFRQQILAKSISITQKAYLFMRCFRDQLWALYLINSVPYQNPSLAHDSYCSHQ